MKLSELIEALEEIREEHSGEIPVVMSSDPEGNSFALMANDGISINKYDRVNREIGIISLTKEHIENGYDEEDVMQGGEVALVLWP